MQTNTTPEQPAKASIGKVADGIVEVKVNADRMPPFDEWLAMVTAGLGFLAAEGKTEAAR